MTDIAIPQQHDFTAPVLMSSIRQVAQDLSDAHAIAKALCFTQFAPAHFRGKPDEAAAAILYGQTINMDPLTALQNLYSIGNKPALYARAMVAIVLSKGHEVWTEEETDERVVVCGKRRGTEHVERSEWTAERARKAGYTSNAQYAKNPRDMLYARASGTIARRIAPDALLGMSYTAEELMLETPVAAAKTVTATGLAGLRAAVAAPDAHVVEEAEPPAADTSELDVEGITPAQLKALQASFKEAGITDRTLRLDYCVQLIGREVESANDLSKTEASAIIDALKADVAPEGTRDGGEV